jgi:hypothetical protein
MAISSLMQTSMGLSMKEGSLILADDMKSLNFYGCKFVLFLGENKFVFDDDHNVLITAKGAVLI